MRLSRNARIVLLVLTAIAFCYVLIYWHPVVEDPRVQIITYQNAGLVRFEGFVESQSRWLGNRVRANLVALTIANAKGDVIWEVQAKDITFAVQEITYGTVPPNFYQFFPKGEESKKLEKGMEYHVYIHSGGSGHATFFYEGP